MAWNVEGRYFENCTCEAPCPCTASLALGADYERCRAVLVFHVEAGEVDGVDVSGLTVAAVADTPKFMHEGNWRLGLLIDDGATDEQAEALGGVFSGSLGGPMEALAPLVSEQLGVERMSLEFTSDGLRHGLLAGDAGSLEVEDVVSFGVESGEPARLVGIFHPVGSELTIAKAGDSHLKVFGLEPDLAGKSAFSSRFAWSA